MRPHLVVATGTFIDARIACDTDGTGLPVTGDITILTFESLDATVVGVRLPSQLAAMGDAGWHLHLVSQGRKIAGHLFGFMGRGGRAE